MATLGIFACIPLSAYAVTFTEQIERLQLVYGALLDFRSGSPPKVYQPGEFALGLELVPVPTIDNRVGAKDEPVTPPPAYGRGRANVGLGAGFAIGAGYLPPIQLRGYRAELYGLEGEYSTQWGAFVAALRGFWMMGTVRGPITDPSVMDSFQVRNTGADARVGWKLGTWTLYGGLGKGQTQSKLSVESDGSESKVNAPYGYGFGGVAWGSGPWALAGEQHQTETYLRHLVFTVRYGF